MSVNFLLANFLSSLKNTRSSAISVGTCCYYSSNFIDSVAQKLIEFKFIEKIETLDDKLNHKKAYLISFNSDKTKKPIDYCVMISKPGSRVYANVNDLKRKKCPKFDLKMMRLVFISTHLGILEIQEAIKHNVGGEVLFGISY